MQYREYTTKDKSSWPRGEWDNEPDLGLVHDAWLRRAARHESRNNPLRRVSFCLPLSNHQRATNNRDCPDLGLVPVV